MPNLDFSIGEPFVTIYELSERAGGGGFGAGLAGALLLLLGLFVVCGGLTFVDRWIAKTSHLPPSTESPFKGRIAVQVTVGAGFALLGLLLVFIQATYGANWKSLQHRAALSSQMVVGEVEEFERTAVQFSAGTVRSARAAFAYRSIQIDGYTFVLTNSGAACSMLPHADFEKSPVSVGDIVRVTFVDGMVVKIELQAASKPVLIPCIGLRRSPY